VLRQLGENPDPMFGPARYRVRAPLLLRWVIAASVIVGVFAWSPKAHAYAWMIRHGYGGCSVCHADPSGGELLTRYGRAQGDVYLRFRWGADERSAAGSEDTSTQSSNFDEFGDFEDTEEVEDLDAMDAEEADKEEDEAGGDAKASAKDRKKKKRKKKKKKKKGKEAGDDKVVRDKRDEDDVEDLDALDEEEPEDEESTEEAAAAAEDEGEELSGASASSGFLWGLITPPDWLLLGGSYRHMALYKSSEFKQFPMQLDLYAQMQFGAVRVAGSVGAARVAVGSPHARAAQVTANQGDEWNVISRTHWVGYDFGANNQFTARAGRLNLPFGVRIPEHTMWVREATRTDRESDQHHGVAIAYNGQLFRGEVMGIAGNYQVNPDRYRERGYSAYVETLVTEPFATGVSSLLTTAAADIATREEDDTVRGAHGIFTRWRVSKPWVVMFEMNALHMSRRDLGYVGFLQLDWEPVQGLHLMGTGEMLDRGYKAAESEVAGIDVPRETGFGKPQLGGWLSVDWFLLPHVELRADAVFRQLEPMTLLGQLHVYL
jgi:hypothetical protein